MIVCKDTELLHSVRRSCKHKSWASIICGSRTDIQRKDLFMHKDHRSTEIPVNPALDFSHAAIGACGCLGVSKGEIRTMRLMGSVRCRITVWWAAICMSCLSLSLTLGIGCLPSHKLATGDRRPLCW